MLRLRSIILGSLLLALDGYIVVYGYMCPSISCINSGVWLLWSLYFGSQLGMLLATRYSGDSSPSSMLSILVLGYGFLLAASLAIFASATLLLTTLISLIPLIFSLHERDKILYYVSIIASLYIGFIMLLMRVTPDEPYIVIVGVITAIFETIFVEDVRISSNLDKRYTLLSIAIGLIILLVLGFASVYGLSPYSLLDKYSLTTHCTRSYYCIKLRNVELPVAAWGYMLLAMLALAWSSVILTLPAPARR